MGAATVPESPVHRLGDRPRGAGCGMQPRKLAHWTSVRSCAHIRTFRELGEVDRVSGIVFIIILLVLMIPLFLTTRRQKKMMRQTQETQANLDIGDEVMTTAGLHGEVVALQDSTVDLEIAEGVVTRWQRVSIRERLTAEADEAEDLDDEDVRDDPDADDETDADAVGDSDEEFNEISEEEIEGFSVEDLSPEDFALDDQTSDVEETSPEARARRDGGASE